MAEKGAKPICLLVGIFYGVKRKLKKIKVLNFSRHLLFLVLFTLDLILFKNSLRLAQQKSTDGNVVNPLLFSILNIIETINYLF